MTAEQLRNSILQEAFSGSLTHDDLSEWEYVTLGDICNFGKCESVDVKDIPNDAWVLELEDIEKDTARILKRLTLRERKIKGTRHKFQKGQLLYSKLRTYLNKVLVAPADGYCTGEIVPITFKEGISVEYMCHFMRSPFVLQYTASCGYGIKMPRVNPKQMNGIEVPLPPLAEQKRIVAKLEELLPIVEQYGKAQKELDELNAALPARLRQSILQEAISGRLVPQDPNDEPASVLLERMQNDKRKVIPIQDEEMPYEIPGSWEWVNLGSIVSIITGKKDANFGSEDGTYDFFTCSNTPIKCKSYSYDGDYLIMPGNGANIGKVIHYKGKFEAYQRTYLLQGYGNFDLDYLKYHLMCNWKEYNQDKLYGSAIPYIKLGNLMSYPVALPPLAEQQRIVAKIEELFEQIDKISQ